MINISVRINDFVESILKLKSIDLLDIPTKTRKEIENVELNYIVYVKGFKPEHPDECKGVMIVAYSNKKFKNVIKKIEKTYQFYCNLEITDDCIEQYKNTREVFYVKKM